MTILLDKCAFIWMSTDETRLSAIARSALADPNNRRLVSAISVLEMAIKFRLKKLKLNAPLHRAVEERMGRGVIDELPVTIEHALAVERLPLHHGDPFDRLIIAQALTENLAVITNDSQFQKYAVPIVW